MLADALGIRRWAAVIGGSLGGMQVMQWAIDLPQRIAHAVVIAAAPRVSAQNIAFNEIARQAILSDPEFHGGRYYGQGVVPSRGLKLARMLGPHHLPVGRGDAQRRYRPRAARDGDGNASTTTTTSSSRWKATWRHQGQSFVDRFDANTYLLMTKALDYFDPARMNTADDLAAAHSAGAKREVSWLRLPSHADWRFSPARSREIVKGAGRRRGAR